jgi:hypothetical protein
MTEFDALRVDPARVVECTGRQGLQAWGRLQSKAEITATSAAERDIEPSAGFVRYVTIAGDFATGDLDLTAIEHDLGAERSSRPALAPRAMADRYS